MKDYGKEWKDPAAPFWSSIVDLLEETGVELPDGPYETAGGFVMHYLGRIPVENDIVGVNGLRITVLSMEGKRVGRLLISRNY